jgi:hypothetical protein
MLYNVVMELENNNKITFRNARWLPIEQTFLSEFYKDNRLNKNVTKTDKKASILFLGEVLGNLSDSLLLDRTLMFGVSRYPLSRKIKKVIINGLQDRKIIEHYQRGFYYDNKEYSVSKFIPGKFVLETIDYKNIPISKSWNVVLKSENKYSLLKCHDEENKILFHSQKNFQRRVNIPLRGFKRIFNNDKNSGGRIYSNFQHMPKSNRELIRIDDEDTSEIDYKYNHLRMLMFINNIPEEDPYLDYGIDRNIVKKALNCLINAENPKRVLCDMRFESSFRWSSKKADAFIETAYKRYPVLEKYKGSRIALKLQKLEGDISIALMEKSLYNGTVVLPIHDSFIVKNSEKSSFESVMEETWHNTIDRAKKANFLAL